MHQSRFYSFFTLALVVFFGLNSTSCKDKKKVIKQTQISFVKEGELSILQKETDSLLIQLDIEIADTDYDVQTGLMYRNSMNTNQAMLFVFNDLRPRNFYMKNTRIPLDLIFIDQNKTIVSFQKNAKPFDETALPSNAAAKYVLEINAGHVNQWGITIGDRIFFKNMIQQSPTN